MGARLRSMRIFETRRESLFHDWVLRVCVSVCVCVSSCISTYLSVLSTYRMFSSGFPPLCWTHGDVMGVGVLGNRKGERN